MFKMLFKKSRWIHKYLGLIFILFFILEGISGIILNHPGIVSAFDVPSFMVPPQYKVNNWNRSSLVKMVFSSFDKKIGFIGGKKGVWKTKDGGMTFTKLTDGYPSSQYYGKVSDLLLVKNDFGGESLYACTFAGLYRMNVGNEKWVKLFPEKKNEKVLKILDIADKMVIFTPSHAYISKKGDKKLDFKVVKLLRNGGNKVKKVSLVRLFFDLHGGKIWGIAGKIFFDIIALLLIFLSISAFYIWIYPKKWKRSRSSEKKELSGYGFFYKYHLKIGIWVAFVLLIIGITAFFMRPPFLALIANGEIDVSLYPSKFPSNPWDEKIHNALHYSKNGKILIEATDGIWEGNDDFSGEFKKIKFPVEIFVMGTTVFSEYYKGGVLAGSFNGIFHISDDGKITDIITGENPGEIISFIPADIMVAGYFITPDGEEFITGFEKGIIPLNGVKREGRFDLPDKLKSDKSFPLWNYMLEIHNGRIFKDAIGGLYILIIPLGALLFILIVITGIYDWLFSRFTKKSSL